MAASMAGPYLLTLLVCASLLSLQPCNCTEFDVGERTGWTIPPENATGSYNNWASRKRFQIGDKIRFKYKKDSVMEVNRKDYGECNSTRPNYFSNTGNTVYTLDRSGFFYFISGSAGHCQKGQRVVVWVVGQNGPTGGASGPGAGLTFTLVLVILAVLVN